VRWPRCDGGDSLVLRRRVGRNVRGEPSAGERVPDERRFRRRVPGYTADRFCDRFLGDHQGTVQGAGHGRRLHGSSVSDRFVEDLSDPEEDELYDE